MHITRDATIARHDTKPCKDWSTYGDDCVKIHNRSTDQSALTGMLIRVLVITCVK